MKNTNKLFGFIAIVAVIGFSALSLIGCEKVEDVSDLSGTITISPSTSVTTGTELTATYSGTETVTFQWKKDGSNVGTASTTTPNKYTPTAAGSYTVTVSADGFNPKTSAAVTVTVPTGPTWTNVANSPFASTDYIYSIVYGNNKFVAGTMGGKLAYSSDGVTWQVVTNSPLEGISKIAFGGGKFVAGGKGKLAYSSDGTTWAAVDVSDENKFGTISSIKVFYCNDTFIAVGSSNQWATSTDGVTWDFSLSAPSGVAVSAIAYGNDTLVAGGGYFAGESEANKGKKIAYSSDNGETWTRVDVGSIFLTDSNNILSIIFGNGKFVATMMSGKMATSTDGITWTAVTNYPLSTLTSPLASIIYDNNKFITIGMAIAGGGINVKFATSTDLTTWTTTDIPDITGQFANIAYGGGKLVAGSYDGKIAYFSYQ
ncbi:hypothetical protein [Treponema sp. R80B11-R83G3]